VAEQEYQQRHHAQLRRLLPGALLPVLKTLVDVDGGAF
jgi:hypothetical protein